MVIFFTMTQTQTPADLPLVKDGLHARLSDATKQC